MADVSGKFYSAVKVRTGVSPSTQGTLVGETLPPVNPPGGGLNSVGLTMPSAFTVANSPLTSNGSIDVTGAGTTAQYIRGDGSLENFPSLTGYVPYTGATQNVDLGEFGVDAGFVQFDTTPTNTPTTQGTMFWDADDETVDVVLNGYTMKIGEDLFYPVKNQTGSNIPKGTAVRFAGTVGNSGRLLIAPFIADGSVVSSRFMGVTAEAIANGADGKVLYFGRVRGINTNAFNEGDILYASTTVAGGFQTAIPVAPNNIVQVAAVVTKSINQGTIFVRPTLGSNINKDEGVKITSPATGQLLQLQAGGLWENKTIAQVLGGTSSQFVKGDGSLDSNVYALNSALASYQLLSAKGQPNGYAGLDSNGKVPLAQINDALIGNVNFQGLWNAATNTPTLANPPASETKGNYYIVSTAGTFAGISFEVGDWIISNGSAWGKVDNTDAVSSVFGRTGNVTASNGDYNTSQVTESGNLYYTEARVNANTNVAANTAARHNAVTLGTANGLSLSTQQLSLGLASAGVTGALSGTDWTTFNNKQNALTNPVTGTGNTNYLSKFTGASTIGNSLVFDNGTQVAVATNNASGYGTQRFLVLGNGAASQVTRFTDGANGDLVFDFPSQGVTRITSQFGTGGSLVFANGTGFNPRMTLDPSGNLGLGVTPQTWWSSRKALEIFGGGAFAGVNAGWMEVWGNGYLDSLATSRYLQNGGAGLYQIGNLSANSHQWFTAPSGTAGNAISFTQAMTLTSGGNLLVGTTSDNGARLQVSGTATLTNLLVGTSATQNGRATIATSSDEYLDIVNTTEVNTKATGIRFGNYSVTDGFKKAGIFYQSVGDGASRGDLIIALNTAFNTNNVTPANAVMTFKGTSGNVGIGTTSPSGKLEVRGVLRVTEDATHQMYVTVNSSYAEIQAIRENIAFDKPLILQRQGGNLLVGTTSDNGARLQVSGSATVSSNLYISGGTNTNVGNGIHAYYESNFAQVQLNGVTGSLIDFSTSGTDFLGRIIYFNSSNSMQFHTASSTACLTLASTGAATFSSSVTATSFFESSDASLKTLVEDNYQAKGIDSVVAKLYIKNGKEELGYYAQDLQGVLPSAVSKGSNGLLNLSYREVHTAKIAYLEQRIKQMENELGRIS